MRRRLNKYKAASPLESHKEFNWKLLKECEIRIADRVQPVEILLCFYRESAAIRLESRSDVIYLAQHVSAGVERQEIRVRRTALGT